MSGDLQRELKQSQPFPSSEEELWLSLCRTTAVLSHVLEGNLRRRGLSLTQYNVLRILRGAPDGLCQQDIRGRLVAQVPDVPRILERMEKHGSIQRRRGSTDRRTVIATLTEAGRELVDDLDKAMEDWMSSLFGHIPAAERLTVIETLTRVRAGVQTVPGVSTLAA